MGSIYFVDSQAYTVIRKDNIDAVPVKILPTGHYDLEYRIVICTRENDVFVLRKNNKGDCHINSFYIREHPFNVIFCSSQFVFATRRRRLIFYSQKFRRQNSMQFDEDIVDLEHFYYEPKQYEGVLVALGNEINLYIDQLRVDTIRMDRPIEKFGRMGREEGVLVISTEGGGLCVKIFRRVATFDEGTRITTSGIQQRKSANISSIELPKRSRTFVDQSLRERENPKLLHQARERKILFLIFPDRFINEIGLWLNGILLKLLQRWKAGGGLGNCQQQLEGLNLCKFNMNCWAASAKDLAAGSDWTDVLSSITPHRLLEIENVERWLIFIFNEQEYSFSHRMIFIPRLFPNKQLKFYSDIYCLHPDKQHLIGEEETEIRIILMRKDRTKPVWSANFQMPASELLIE
uniref:Bardet-Biedl syndrome 1 N-terminal domain-containing protein n=2 Tax=Meloidogyne TaxID=189290 RepID=A0A914L259_MELIC